MKRMLLCMAVLTLCTTLAYAKGKGWRTDESEKYLAWWDRTYKGTDSAVIGGVLYQKEDYETAVAELEKAIQAGSSDGRVYYQLAYSYQQLGDIDKAIELYQTAGKLLDEKDPAHRYHYYAKYNLALLYKDKGDIDGAIGILQEAIDKHKNEPGAHNLLGWLYWKKGDTDNALKEYRISIKIDPNQEDAQYNLGVLYYNKGEVEDAKAVFNKVLELNPDHKKASAYLSGQAAYAELLIPEPALRHCYLGKQKLDKGQYQDAALEYETALEVNPNCMEAHQGLGVVYEYNDKGVRYGDGFRIEKSVFHYEKALMLNPNLAEVVFNISVLYSQLGKVDDAIRLYLRLIRIEPNNSQAHYNLAVLYDNQTKNAQKAIHHYTRYIELEPQTPKKTEIEERIRRLRTFTRIK